MPGENTNFRKILLNKCQKEFEKEKLDDLQMEKDRSKTFENVGFLSIFLHDNLLIKELELLYHC